MMALRKEPPYHDVNTNVMIWRINEECDPTGDVDDVNERDAIVAKAIASGPPLNKVVVETVRSTVMMALAGDGNTHCQRRVPKAKS